ncbi:MAG: serine hydrolase domain-containing protein [Cellulosilyticaceae bacterium]
MHQERMSAYLDRQKKFSGVVLLAKGQDIVGTYTAGYADPIKHDPITEESQFVLPGISKLFAVLAVMNLSRAGAIRKEDLVKKYVPQLDNGKGINIAHLMNHTSGIADFIGEKEIDCYTQQQPWQIVKAMIEKKPRFDPGKKCMESTTDYLFLAHIIEVITGERYRDFVTREIMTPLGLKHTCFVEDTPQHLVRAYQKGKAQDLMDASVLLGWSDVVSTAEDLFRLRCEIEAGNFIPYRMIEEMENPIGRNRYADAYRVDELWKEKCVYLMGMQSSGYGAYMAKYKNTNYLTIVLSSEAGKLEPQVVEQGMMEKVRNERLSFFKKMV